MFKFVFKLSVMVAVSVALSGSAAFAGKGGNSGNGVSMKSGSMGNAGQVFKSNGNSGVVGPKGSPVIKLGSNGKMDHDKFRDSSCKFWWNSYSNRYCDYSYCRVVRIERQIVVCGGELVLIGEGMNAPAIAVRIDLNGLALDGAIIAREPNKLVVRMPNVELAGPMIANVQLILPNGELTPPVTVQVFPAR